MGDDSLGLTRSCVTAIFVPTTGYSYLDLHLMGLISSAEVPDLIVLKNLTRVGKERDGHTRFKAERTMVTIQDVIAAVGPRLRMLITPKENFNTEIVVVGEHLQSPSHELIEQANGRQQWIRLLGDSNGTSRLDAANPR